MSTFIVPGAAARGAYQASLMNTLAKQGIVPDALFGVSAGAISAVGYSCCGPQGLVDIWSGLLDLFDVFSPAVGAILKGRGLMNANPISKVLFKNAANKFPQIPVTFAKVKSETGEVVYINSSDVSMQVLLDSTVSALSIPVVCQDWQGYCDAGPMIMAPVKEAIRQGHKDLVFILDRPLHPAPLALKSNLGPLNLISIITRTIDRMLFTVLYQDIQWAIEHKQELGLTLTAYCPPTDLYEISDFKSIPLGIKLGETEWVKIDL